MIQLLTVSVIQITLVVYKRLKDSDRRLDNHDKKFGDIET